MFRQTVKTVQSLYNDKSGFDSSYKELKQFCKNRKKNIVTLDLLDRMTQKNIVFVRKEKNKMKLLNL